MTWDVGDRAYIPAVGRCGRIVILFGGPGSSHGRAWVDLDGFCEGGYSWARVDDAGERRWVALNDYDIATLRPAEEEEEEPPPDPGIEAREPARSPNRAVT